MKDIAVIDIGSKNLHVAKGSYNKGQLVVTRTESYEVPKQSIIKEEVTNETSLAEAIQFALKLCDYSGKDIIITMNAAEHRIVKELEFPKAKPKELYSMIKNEMHQVHNILASDIIQYKAIGKSENENLDRYSVTSIPEDFVKAYYDTLKSANLKPVAMDINTNAMNKLLDWTQAINGQEIPDQEAFLLIDFGHTTTAVYIGSNQEPLFFRHINMGSEEIDRILSSELHKSKAEIEEIKAHEDFFAAGYMNDENQPYQVLRPYFDRLNDEIRRVLTFFRGRFRHLPINQGYILGNGSNLKGYSEFWELSLNIHIEQINSLKGKNSEEINVNPAHVNAIAALIRN